MFQEEILLAGYRPPARIPRTPKGKRRMQDHDPVEGITREWHNRNRSNKRSRTVSDNLTPYDLDKEASALISDLVPIINTAVGRTSPKKPTDLSPDSMAEALAIDRENVAMMEGAGEMRPFNIGSAVFPTRFETLKQNIYRGLDNHVQTRMDKWGMTDYIEAVDSIGMTQMPPSLYGTNQPLRRSLANDFLAEWKSLRKQAAADRTGMIMDLPAKSSPLGEPIETFNDVMFPGI